VEKFLQDENRLWETGSFFFSFFNSSHLFFFLLTLFIRTTLQVQ